MVELCNKTGILSLFDEIKDLYDYLLGIEVGLDSNTRKNRSGKIFEKMCQEKIKRLINPYFMVVNNDQNFSLYKPFSGNQKGKTHDFVVYKGNTPILIVECNFYNVGGSKPISIAESYIELQKAAKEKNVIFLWITDGPAWHKMKDPLLRAMKKIDYIVNYKMLSLIKKILKNS
uniref:Restriction endonuclease type II DpnII-like domain-containing protein n=1 Tax=candidate division WOR-3 bacterium TaxID=2052148 RepID=A0A7C2NZJ0_UNCW3